MNTPNGFGIDRGRCRDARDRRFQGVAWPALLAAVVVATVGCNRHPSSVAGSVTLDGKPLPTGVIMLTPARSGPSAYGAIAADGSYRLQTGAAKGLEPGEYIVTVAANEPPPAGSAGGEGRAAEAIRPLMTPPEYSDVKTSPLRITVKPGSQTVDLELKKSKAGSAEADAAK